MHKRSIIQNETKKNDYKIESEVQIYSINLCTSAGILSKCMPFLFTILHTKCAWR